jgi:hypothetical protein
LGRPDGFQTGAIGTITIVKEELDRYLAQNVADPVLEQRLSHLRRDDATWCVATLPENNSEIQAMFRFLDPRLANLLRAGDTLELGTHYAGTLNSNMKSI